jgi:hypothetical protein
MEETKLVLTPATIARLELGPDDIVVVRSAVNLDPERCTWLGETVKEAVGGNKVIVIAPNISLEVIEKW